MGCLVHLPAGGDHEKTTGGFEFALHFSTDHGGQLVREKPIPSLATKALKQNPDTPDCNRVNLFNY